MSANEFGVRRGLMSDLFVCSAAEGEYAEALLWYVDQSVQAAERFDAEFVRSLELIASSPLRFPKCDDRHHFYLMRHFPYQIIYRERNKQWVVISVAHTAREPGYWSDR